MKKILSSLVLLSLFVVICASPVTAETGTVYTSSLYLTADTATYTQTRSYPSGYHEIDMKVKEYLQGNTCNLSLRLEKQSSTDYIYHAAGTKQATLNKLNTMYYLSIDPSNKKAEGRYRHRVYAGNAGIDSDVFIMHTYY